MNAANIISIIIAGMLLLINIYYLGALSGYQKGYEDGRYKTMIEKADEKARGKFGVNKEK